jgi:phosphoglycolate phosphatase-like HAD superfamily hydrolase
MHEEVEALGHEIGENKLVEDIIGSTWNEKKPKDEVMKDLIKELEICKENILVVGDGRAEISAGTELGALVISRLPETATYQRELHKKLGTNVITSDFANDKFLELFETERII